MTYQDEEARWNARLRNLAAITLTDAGWKPQHIESVLGMSLEEIKNLIEYNKLPLSMVKNQNRRAKRRAKKT